MNSEPYLFCRRSLALLVSSIVALLTTFVCGCQSPGGTQAKSEGGWRALPLVNNGKGDPSWVQVGWGGFGAGDGNLGPAPQPKSLRLLLYRKESFGKWHIRVVF